MPWTEHDPYRQHDDEIARQRERAEQAEAERDAARRALVIENSLSMRYRAERDLAYSVLRKLHVETSDEGTPDAIDWYVVEKSLLADEQRALVERLRDEQ